MEQQDLERLIREKEGVASAAFPALMRKVYVWMTLALIITGVTAYGVAHSEVLMQKVLESRGIFWGFLLAELGLVWIISRFIGRLSLTTATLLF
ncbi:MAG: Bax inhibitor-1 family protein, partial [Prevotella shahii]|nr:Bax inhibitor-1 family protein [Hoylesella shahii]